MKETEIITQQEEVINFVEGFFNGEILDTPTLFKSECEELYEFLEMLGIIELLHDNGNLDKIDKIKLKLGVILLFSKYPIFGKVCQDRLRKHITMQIYEVKNAIDILSNWLEWFTHGTENQILTRAYKECLEYLENNQEYKQEDEDEYEDEDEDEDMRLTTGKSGKEVFRTMSTKEIKEMPSDTWLVPGVFWRTSVSLGYGEPKTKKTFVMLDLSFHIAHGMNWHGLKLKQSQVLYICAEGDTGLRRRIEAWQKYYGKDDIDYIQFICYPIKVMTELQLLCDTIEEQIITPSFIIIDTFSACAPDIKSENDNVQVARFISCALYIKQKYNTHVHIIHHAGKNNEYRGASAFKGNVDSMIHFTRGNNNLSITMHSDVQRDSKDFEDIVLQLKEVELGFDEEANMPITSLVVIPEDIVSSMTEKTDEQNISNSDNTDEKICMDMISCLNALGVLTTAKWREACKDKGISKNVFDKKRPLLVESGRVVLDDRGNGLGKFYSVPGSQL
jgi:hypothetical protein